MKTQMNDNSLDAIEALRRNGRLQPLQERIINVLIETGRAYTRKQLARITGMELSSVCGRVNSLIAAGVLEVIGDSTGQGTGKKQGLIGLTKNKTEASNETHNQTLPSLTSNRCSTGSSAINHEFAA